MIKIIFLLAAMMLVAETSPRHVEKTTRPPNIILIIADDLGYGDLASYGNLLIQTPYIDGLGGDGVRFTHAYVSAPICAPSRMGIMTGRCQNRFGCEYMPYQNFDPPFLKDLRKNYFALRKDNPGLKSLHPNFTLNQNKYHTGLPANEITVAELLKKNGYATGLVGKWNLGEAAGDHPYECGFDYCWYFDGALTRYVDDPVDTTRYINQHLPWAFSELPAWTRRAGSTALREGTSLVTDTGYLTFSIADRGTAFIEKEKNHPFFLTLAFNAPHDPFQVPKAYFDRLQTVHDTVKRVYYGMIEALDDAVGEILEKLKETGLADQTIIFFISDNGGATYTRAADNGNLRGGKCTHFEGGLEVPFFIKYPGVIPGETVYDKPVSALDIFSTITAMAGISLPSDRVYDGVNLLPFLANKDSSPHKIFFWRSGYSMAVRKGDWKLYVNDRNKKIFLFDLANDPGEKHDLSSLHPDIKRALLGELREWEKRQTTEPVWPSAADVEIEVDAERYYFPG